MRSFIVIYYIIIPRINQYTPGPPAYVHSTTNLSTLKKAAADISYLSKKCVQKGELDDYWKRFDALTPANVVKAIYTEDVIRAIRLRVKKNCGMNFNQAEITDAIQGLLIREHPDAIRPKNLKK